MFYYTNSEITFDLEFPQYDILNVKKEDVND